MPRVLNYFLIATLTILGTAIILSSAKETQHSIEHAVIPKSEVTALIGHPVTISCLSQDDSPLDACRWERRPPLSGNNRYLININRSGKNSSSLHVNNPPGFNCNCTYEYSGVGLDNGDCSITIRNVSEFHMKKWECLLTGKKGRTWIGSLYVESYETVHKPYFENERLLDKIIYDKAKPSRTNVTCCANEPDHSLYINIFLKNETKVSSLFHESRNDTLYIRQTRACRHTSFTFLPKHNGQSLICNATSFDELHKHELTTFLRLSVEFGPVLKKADWSGQDSIGNNSLEINVTFSANPWPNVTWYLYTDKENNNMFEISSNHTKYTMCLHHLYGDKYAASIRILNVEKEDYRRLFKLRLWNEHGSQEVDVRVHSRDEQADANEKFWIMILIIGLGVVILFVFIFVVVWTVIRNSDGTRGSYFPASTIDDRYNRNTVPDRETAL